MWRFLCCGLLFTTQSESDDSDRPLKELIQKFDKLSREKEEVISRQSAIIIHLIKKENTYSAQRREYPSTICLESGPVETQKTKNSVCGIM
jgi:hypothetical protein